MNSLCHYTDRDGLAGIAKSRALWATNFLQLNDSSEYFYAYEALQYAAYTYLMQRIPTDLKIPGLDVASQSKKLIDDYKGMIAASEGYGQLYVISFARGRTDDHEQRGMLTLWDRYTNQRGYCLQFDRAYLQEKLELEQSKATYNWAKLDDVVYGYEKSSREFETLAKEIGEALMLHVARTYQDDRIRPDLTNRMAPSVLDRKLVAYCAKHKDPFFEDEREVRLVLFPAAKAEARVFTGIASRKDIKITAAGRKYIAFGEHWEPGIVPARIIVGPKADPDISDIVRQFDPPPEIVRTQFPLK